MMTLKTVANIFHTVVFQDTYGTATLNGCLLPYTDSKRSSEISMRRILEVLPDVVLPEQLTLTEVSTGQVFILSAGSYDFWDSSVIRRKIPVTPVYNSYSVQTIAQVLAGAGGSLGVYASPSYIRKINIQGQSDYADGFSIFFSPYYSFPSGVIVYRDGEYYRLRQSTYADGLGFNVAEAVLLDSPVQAQSIKHITDYDPETESSTTSQKSVKTFVEPYDLDHSHIVIGFKEMGDGDQAVSVLKTDATMSVGDIVGISGRVIAVVDNGSVWTCQVRRNQL